MRCLSLEKKQRWLNRDIPSEDVSNLSQSHNEIYGMDREEAINKEIDTVQGPTSYDEEIKLQKAWAMAMLMMDSDISTMEADEQEQIEENNKKFLYARSVHANHMIQHHVQEIIERQRVVDEYRSMADGKRELIPRESDQFKKDLVLNQHIMQMIDTDILWYEKTFREILVELWKIQNGKTVTQTSEEHSEKEMINHYDESHAMFNNLRLYKGEKTQQD